MVVSWATQDALRPDYDVELDGFSGAVVVARASEGVVASVASVGFREFGDGFGASASSFAGGRCASGRH